MSWTVRGNATATWSIGSGWSGVTYEWTGVAHKRYDLLGRFVKTGAAASTAYSLPTQIRPNDSDTLATTIGYNGAFQVASVTGADGANTATEYDQWGRPARSLGPVEPATRQRAITTYTYPTPTTQVATLGTRWKKTTFDGFARVIKVETGYGGTTVSTADTEYGPCACSALGKMKRQSAPYAAGETIRWTTYTYDACGRTLTIKSADNDTTT